MLKTGNSSYINDIFLNNLAGTCAEIAVFGRFSGFSGRIADALRQFQGDGSRIAAGNGSRHGSNQAGCLASKNL